MSISALLEDFERVGGRLTIEGGQVEVQYPKGQRVAVTPILTRLRECREEVIRLLQDRSAGTVATTQVQSPPRRPIDAQEIPTGAILLAPKYDSKPLERIPSCWCCPTPYKLNRIQEWQGKQYAYLDPGCGCLTVPQALACCGLCVSHCTCKDRRQ